MKSSAIFLFSATALFAAPAFTDTLALGDMSHEIEAASHAADLATLDKLQQSLLAASKQAPTDKYLAYYLGYADYYLADYYADSDASKATDCLHDAESALEAAVKLDPDFAEADALLGNSYGFEIGLHPYKGMWLGAKSAKYLGTAMSLSPHDPRVLMMQGVNDYSTPASFGGDKKKGLQEYSQALTEFGSYKAAEADAPTWGHAEAYVLRGDAEADAKDDQAAAKDYQAALGLDPNYKLAALKLGKLTAAASQHAALSTK